MLNDYNALKRNILLAYERVPEFYRKNCRNFSKRVHETYSDFAAVLNTQVKRWVSGLKAYNNVEKLRQVMLIEQFVEKLPADIRL